MDFEALLHARFGKLDTALTDWDTLIKNLHRLEKSANDGMKATAVKSEWHGVNSAVGKKFIVKTAGEFADAHTQATSIRNILRDTVGELRTHKRDLEDAISRARGRHIVVRAAGKGYVVEAAEGDTGKDVQQKDVDAVRSEIDGILGNATKSDNSAAKVLRALVDQADKGFGDAVYKDRDQAATAMEKGEELAALARKDPGKLTPAEFDRLNEGLARYGKDTLFATTFAQTLGAQGTLDFWAGLNNANNHDLPARERFDKYPELQKNLGLTLANATQSGSIEMSQWKSDMLQAVEKPVGGSGGVSGYVVMSNLMRSGDYEDDFLKNYGSNMIAKEQEGILHGDSPERIWGYHGGGLWPHLNTTGTDFGFDPMTGYMKALSVSPDAATAFFTEEFVGKDTEGNPYEREYKGADGEMKEGPTTLSNFQYLFEERDWMQDQDSKGEDSIAGKNYLAAAVEAATTGHPAGELPTHETPAHNADQAKLMSQVVHSVSKDPSRLLDNGFMSDSLGQMASEYLPDINRSLSDDEKSDSIKKLFPIDGPPESVASLKHNDVTRFLVTVGQDDEAYSAISVGQQAYMASLMDHHLNPDLPADQRYSDDPKETIQAISRQSAEIGGTLAIGQQEAVFGEAKEEDDDYAHSMSQRKNLISGGVGTVVGVGTSLIATPAGGAAASGVAGTVTSVVIEAMFKDKEGSALAGSAYDAGELWQQSHQAHISLSQTAATEAAKAHGQDYADDVERWTREATDDGFNDAATNARHMADDLDTEIPAGS